MDNEPRFVESNEPRDVPETTREARNFSVSRLAFDDGREMLAIRVWDVLRGDLFYLVENREQADHILGSFARVIEEIWPRPHRKN